MELRVTNGNNHFSHTPEIKNNTENEKGSEARIAKAARDFESLLTSMMLKSMAQGKEGGLFGGGSEDGGFGGDYFDMIFQQEIASKFSEGKGLGIADMLFRKITGKPLPSDIPAIKLNSFEDVPIKNYDTGLRSLQPGEKSLNRLRQYEKYIDEASEKFGVNKNLIKSVILTESAANEKAVSKAKAKGLMQLIDSTASDMGVNNVWNPRENIMGGTKYLSQMLRQYNGDLKLALAGYNAGPGNVNKYNGVPPFDETKKYITRVMSYMNHLKEADNEA
ncbi:MAG: transglycosylase SLT domain-containing protein [Ignavibacteriaceae bacterium]